ncbi:hypothetical protein GG496_002277 [Candidatus Fervidibacteria bacterium JGI MDM2 JNZ-1-D12]
MKPPNFVRCRPVGVLELAFAWLVVVILLAIVEPVEPKHLRDFASFWFRLLYAVIGIPSLLALLWSLWAQVIADERGLRWRLGWQWKQVSWEEIADFYTQIGRKANWSVIETRQGNLRLHEGLWNNLRELRDIVQRKATNAKTTEWAIYGSCPCDLPREFRYDEQRIRELLQSFWIALAMLAFLVALVAYLLIKSLPPKDLLHLYWWRPAAMVMIALCSLLILPSASLRELARDGQRRFHHRIIVTNNGVIFDGGEKQIEACWDEVTDYFVAQFGRWVKIPARCVVVTEKGSFDFTTMLKDYKVLKRLIEQNARNASVKGWRLEGERLGKPMQQHGAMVFHYRTRSNRALLLVGTGLALLVFVVALMRKDVAGFVLTAVLAIPTIWFWWRYFTVAIVLDERGITQIAPFSKRFIAWDDVQSYSVEGSDLFGIVTGSQKRIVFWFSISDYKVLGAEIKRRLKSRK